MTALFATLPRERPSSIRRVGGHLYVIIMYLFIFFQSKRSVSIMIADRCLPWGYPRVSVLSH